jgi:hypothetical protein
VTQNKNFEGQLPKLRYYHHIKKIEPQEENNNVVSVKEQPITASSKKNGSSGQMKITGKATNLLEAPTLIPTLSLICRLPQGEKTTHDGEEKVTDDHRHHPPLTRHRNVRGRISPLSTSRLIFVCFFFVVFEIILNCGRVLQMAM